MIKKYSLGLDIKNGVVTGILLEKIKGITQLVHQFESEDFSVLRSSKIRSTMRSLKIATAISKEYILQKSLSLPIYMSEYDIECEVSNYVKKNFEGEFYFDFFVIGESKITEEQIDIKIMLTNKKEADKIIKLISKENLKVNKLEIRENMIELGKKFNANDLDEKYYAAYGCALRGFDE